MTLDMWRKNQEIEHFDPSQTTDKDQVNKKFFLLDYLDLGGWRQVAENILPYVKERVLNGTNGSSFFFDSFECFI